MKLNSLLITTAAIAALALVGCGNAEPEAVSTPTTPVAGPGADSTPATSAAALAEEQEAGPYLVVLTTEPAEPRVGKAELRARVTEGGSPVEGAKVVAVLSMPKMDMGGPTVELKQVEPGVYVGTTELSMGGDWHALVKVESEGTSGEAGYDFVAMQ